ncbi:MAG: response regulator transcription factor [Cyclobacteriaceae bacterium]
MNQNKFRTIVVDDDKLQLEVITDFVKSTNFLEFDGAFHDPLSALEYIVNATPDVVLLDVEMPKLSGLDLVKSLNNPPRTIIITGKPDYAVEAFELDVVDYLLKPVDNYPRFLKAATKACEGLKPYESQKIQDVIYVKENSLLVSVNVKDIRYFEAFGDYVKVATEKKVYVIHSTMAKIEKQLTAEFFRIHRSFLVRLDQIKNIDQTNIQIGDKIIPISQPMKPKLMERIKKL